MKYNIPQIRIFSTKKEALKAEFEMNGTYHLRNTSDSKAKAECIYCYETGLYYLLLGYEIDKNDPRCILDYSDYKRTWIWVYMQY